MRTLTQIVVRPLRVNRTEWSPIQSVIIQVKSNGIRAEWSSIRSVIIRVITNFFNFFIMSMITERIEQHEVLSMNHKKITISEKRRKAKI